MHQEFINAKFSTIICMLIIFNGKSLDQIVANRSLSRIVAKKSVTQHAAKDHLAKV